MVCPILISVSVTPGALSARAALAAKVAAAALDCRNVRRVIMTLSLSIVFYGDRVSVDATARPYRTFGEAALTAPRRSAFSRSSDRRTLANSRHQSLQAPFDGSG